MGNKAAASVSTPELDSGKPRVKSIGSGVLPAAVSSIVAEYLSGDSSDYVKAALIGVQPITLCLSQNADDPPAMVPSLDCVSPEHQWPPGDLQIDKQFSFKDQEACLHFLEQTNSNYCPVAIEVLIVIMTMHSIFSTTQSLDDLNNTIRALQKHLKSVKRVVIFVEYYTCLIYSLQETIGTVAGAPQPVNHLKALTDIIYDLADCWYKNYLTSLNVFAFYFKSNVARKSEKYLTKFVISLHHSDNQELFNKEASHIVSNKIMWVLNVKNHTAYRSLPDYTRMCHVFHWYYQPWDKTHDNHPDKCSENAFCFQDNPFVERIFIYCMRGAHAIQLPCPSRSLLNNSPRSALIELTLEGHRNVIHLTDLNNGYFPNLRHLSIIYGDITGHLDSHRVPLLKTLRIEPGCYHGHSPSSLYGVVREHAQSLIDAGRPWQLVATQTKGGWSLASYDEPTSNPQDEVKDNSTFSGSSLLELPRIRKLLLVGCAQQHFDEWQKQLLGFPSLEAAAKDHDDRLLVWAPECVEKITPFCRSWSDPRLEFKEITGKTRILTSLECYFVNVEVDGVAVPKLQSLEVNDGLVKLSGAFPHLQRLKLNKTTLHSQWHVEAPLLQSLDCCWLKNGQKLSLSPNWLPQLSSLEILLFEDDPTNCPVILDDKGRLRFSRVDCVYLGYNMALTPFFDQCQVTNVSDLELVLNVLQLPACWHDRLWHCKKLTIFLYAPNAKDLQFQGPPIETQLPFLLRVKTLLVKEINCRVLLNGKMHYLTELTVESPRMLGKNLRCPALKRIRFTEKLSDIDKELCLDRATYMLLDARPSEIIFAADYQLHTIA